ncbi:MAG: acyl-CoA thioesterase [Deltaproteobacteria bacterium]|nr:acyl-CoA thioesterase [Deltaproteobacteria bacterium]
MTDATRIPMFRRERELEARHIDQLGHVNNLAWIRLTLELADAHASALGCGYEALRARGFVWVVRHQDLHYERSAFLGERLRETTWVSELRGARSLRHTRLRSERGELCFAANTEWAFVDVAKLRPRRVPPDILAAFDLVSLAEGEAAERA